MVDLGTWKRAWMIFLNVPALALAHCPEPKERATPTNARASVSISVSLHLRRADRVGTVIPPKRRQGGGGTRRRVGDYERGAGNHINDGVDGDGTVRGRASRTQLATARTLAVRTTMGLRGLGDEGYSQRGAWECTRVKLITTRSARGRP
ncbi:hypothetical protein B0H14DRAFT_2891791 [Mycena olivaceomarginata]|nr:hypothetical protein B0H14DRAFT_2891791 [Mycena olivaceomarginata]